MTLSEITKLSVLIREKSGELGFDLCGITKAKELTDNGRILKKWCETGMNDRMSYLERNIEKRINPALLFPDVKSLVVTGLSYYSELKQKDPAAPVLSRYAYGTDYHQVITAKLDRLFEFIKVNMPGCKGRIFCDSGPVLEKAWAREAGLGWQGKHSVIINKKTGSFFFIGILMLDIDLEYDLPFKEDLCGDCRLCIDKCPTGAINNDRTIDARKCIANLTIENRGPIPDDIIPRLGGRIYGCDRCQEVCPWNRHAEQVSMPEFTINDEVASLNRVDWQSLTETRYLKLFKNTVIERVKYNDLMRNVTAAIKSMEY
jgi:epoxyqueuosine reductase